jgi:phage host-nuclease inhibitor protein Gam
MDELTENTPPGVDEKTAAYEAAKRKWDIDNPSCTHTEREEAMREICRKVGF